MKPASSFQLGLGAAAGAAAVAFFAACSSAPGTTGTMPLPVGAVATPSGDISLAASPPMRYPANAVVPTPDPRIGLRPGEAIGEAGEAAWNMRFVTNRPAGQGFTGGAATGTDLAFVGNLAIQGNYRGLMFWDITQPRDPKMIVGFLCPTAQGDPSVYRNLVFVSGESNGARNDCGTTAVADSVSMERFRGIRIFDITDPAKPRLVKNVQTCRGSHTNTLVTDPRDKDHIYVYVSGYASVRSANELAGCVDAPAGDSASARFRIEVIKVPLRNPAEARVVNSPHLLADLTGRTVHAPPPSDTVGRGGRGGRGGGGGAGRGNAPAAPQIGQSGCHDITSYPAIGLAGGACAGYGLLFDIRDTWNPKRVASVADSNMSFWHSATFSNDGTKVLFSDEWGGGTQPRCRATDRLEWGANAIFTIEPGNRLRFHSYFKMPAPQTNEEICTAHNGSLIPIPGRDIMVQAFYMGGMTVFDWTDPARPIEIAFFDRGPGGGYWSSYWYNGYIYSSDESRGFDVHELVPSPFLSQNEIDAMKTVRLDQFNPQEQTRFVWPPSFALARAYLDQLERNGGLSATRILEIRDALTAAERASGDGRGSLLTTLGTRIASDVATASDRGRVHLLHRAVVDLSRVR